MYQLSSTLRQAIAAGNPQRVLLEFSEKTFSNEEVSVQSGIRLREFFCQETDLTIGQCLSNELEFTLLNDNFQLISFSFGTFTAWLGAAITSGNATGKTKTFTENGKAVTYEFSPLGTFIATKPDVLQQRIVSLTANDQMILFDKNLPYATALGIEYPTTVGAIFTALCRYVNVTPVTTTFLNSDLTVTDEPEAFTSATCRDVLGWIAEAACANARFNRDGQLEFVWFNRTNKTFGNHDHSDFVPTWYTVSPIDGLHIRNQDSTTEIILGQNSNNYMIQDNPFLRKPDDTVEIVTDPSPLNTTVGVHVSFLCQAKGEGLTYQWQEGTNGAFADSSRNGADTNAMQFVTVAADDRIEFRCVVTDKYGNSATSGSAMLTVTAFAEKTEQQAEADAQAKWPDLYREPTEQNS